MNLRNTYILFAAVVVVLVVFVAVFTFGPRGGEEDYLFPELRGRAKGEELAKVKESVERVEVERISPHGDALLFERTGGKWSLKKPFPARVDSAAVDRLVGSLIDAKVDRKAPAPSKGDAGLDPPSAAVTLMTGDRSYRVLLGQFGLAGGGRVYAATGEKPNRVLVLPRHAIDELLRPGAEAVGTAGEALRSITDYRPANLMADGSHVPWEVVQKITLADGKKELVLQRDTAGGWTFVKPDNLGPADLEGDPTTPATETVAGVKPLLTRLSGLRLPPKEDVIEGADKLAEYGLEPGTESLRVELGRSDGGTDTLLVGKKANPDGSKVYATLAGERLVVKIDAKPLEQVRQVLDNPKAIRDRTLTSILPFAVDAVDITLASEKKFELRRAGTPARWRIFEGSDAYEDANERAVVDLLNALTTRRNVKDFPDSAPGDKVYGLDNPAAVIEIWSDGIEKPEAKPDAKPEEKPKRPQLKGPPNLKLAFGKKDKDVVYVRRTTGVVSSLVAIPESTLDVTTRPLTAYLDLTLPSFDRTKVTKLTFNRGPAKYEIEKPGGDPGAAGWKINQPADLAGRAADATRVDQIIGILQRLAATRVIARKANDAELQRFGLKPPRTEASVALKDAKEPTAYQFGVEADDKQSFYARVGGAERVHVVPKAPLEPLLSGEVADPTVWRFEAARLRGVKITGWKSLTGGMALSLDLVRKSATEWSVKDQPDYAVDAARAETFATALLEVRAAKFVKTKGGPAPEHKLDAKDDVMTVELTAEGEKEPFTLTLGAETKEDNVDYYFAASNKLPGAVFLVPRDRFEAVRKGGRGHFQKAK